MKSINYLMMMIGAVAVMTACNNVSYQKSKSGLLYKIVSTNSKDSVVKPGEWLKFFFSQKLNDSVMQTNYGKMPVYVKLENDPRNAYSPVEVFDKLRKGDSLVTVLLVDSLKAKGIIPQLPPFMKKGDRVTYFIKVVDILKNDSLYQADAQAEDTKYAPQRVKDEEEQRAKMMEQQKQEQLRAEKEMETSGEAAKGVTAMEAYLKQKNIAAKKTGKGTYVVVNEPGTGMPADSGKYVVIKYTGRTLETDSVFESGTVPPFQLGTGFVIPGWDEGLRSFNQGGKGTLYIPGFRAYGKNHPSFKPFQAMIFDVEILNVSDTMPAQTGQPGPQRRN